MYVDPGSTLIFKFSIGFENVGKIGVKSPCVHWLRDTKGIEKSKQRGGRKTDTNLEKINRQKKIFIPKTALGSRSKNYTLVLEGKGNSEQSP